jgi:NAD(P)-dependent dehydrogenase (short-subunit alcohol dehydrogenase family)
MTPPASPSRLDGKRALVTGASRGLGRAICLALADAGAAVTAVARAGDDLAAFAAERAHITPHAADVTDPAFFAWLESQTVDILVNNAGGNRPQPMADVSADTLDWMMNLNVRSAYLVSQAVVRSLIARGCGGSIIHVTSQMGHVGSPNRTVYCLTKHALEGLAKAMAVELAPYDIRVNTVAPTFIETPLTAPMLADPAFRDFVMARIPLGRLGKPEDVASAVAYLASPAAGMVTGTSLRVDGGWTAH